MTQTFFPFTLRATESRSGASSSHDFRDIFLETKRANVRWFAYDVIVRSQTEITFVVRDILDNCYGGIGPELYRYDLAVASVVTESAMRRRARYLAILEIREETFRREDRAILSKMKRMLKKYDL